MKKTLLGLCATLLLSTAAFAADCSIDYNDANFQTKVMNAVKATDNCESAVALANSCAMGSSMDQGTFGAAEAKCMLDFQKKPTELKLFQALASRCVAKYSKSQGTMYISMMASCEMDAAAMLSEVNTKAE